MNFIKGFVVGIGKIIPGVSGAMLAMAMGIYDKSIEYICNFMKKYKRGYFIFSSYWTRCSFLYYFF